MEMKIKTDETGKGLLQYEVCGRIRRIPLPKAGTTRKGNTWKLGGCLLEVADEDGGASAQLYLCSFDEYIIEQLEVIGVGKDVKAVFHIDTREKFDNFTTSCILDSIEGMTDGENILYNIKK